MTALCLTKNRRDWLPKAIECFRAQTFRFAEMLILADGEDVRDLVPEHENIRLMHLADEPGSIGEKRNFGCAQAAGEVICHWDDDDWSAPARLETQVRQLLGHGRSVAGFHSMRFTDGAGSWWQYRGTQSFALGTSLCYFKSWWKSHPFEPKNVGEDNHFVCVASGSGQLSTVDAGALMHATIHAGNTSPRRLSGSSWERVS